MTLQISTIGSFEISRDGEAILLPSSRKTRALLAYLAITGTRHTRRSLCEMFWDRTNDPLAGLRWSLSKLRKALNVDGVEVLNADREAVWFDPALAIIDKDQLNELANYPGTDQKEADEIWKATTGLALEGAELPNQAAYMIWLKSYRQDYVRLRGGIAKGLRAMKGSTGRPATSGQSGG